MRTIVATNRISFCSFCFEKKYLEQNLLVFFVSNSLLVHFFFILGKKSIQRLFSSIFLYKSSFASITTKRGINQVYEIQPQNAKVSSV